MKKECQHAAQPEHNGNWATVMSLAMSEIARVREALGGKSSAVACSSFNEYWGLGWNTAEVQWLRQVSRLATSSGLLLIVAPLVATAIKVYARKRGQRFARTQFVRVCRMRSALCKLSRSAGFASALGR